MALVKAKLDVNFSFEQKGANAFGGPEFAPEFSKTLKFGAGVTSGNADIAFIGHRTISSAGNDDLDLMGVLADAFGATINAAEVVGLIVASDSANANVINIGAGTNPIVGLWGATGDIMKLMPGGLMCNFAYNAAGLFTVVAGTGDILRLNNGGSGAVSYDIAILARSA